MTEKERILEYNQGQIPEGVKIKILIRNLTSPETVLGKIKDVMSAVSQFAYSGNWPTDEEWKVILPQWLVHSMTSKSTEDRDKDANLWHFESWLESMYHRGWVWWSSEITENSIVIMLKALAIPYVFEQLLFTIYGQGISLNNVSVNDDVYG